MILTVLVVIGSGVVVITGLRVVRIDSNVVGRTASVVNSTFFTIGDAGEYVVTGMSSTVVLDSYLPVVVDLPGKAKLSLSSMFSMTS